MEIGQTFDIELDGIENKAQLLDIIEYKDDRYAVYAIEDEGDSCELYTSKVITHEDGTDELVAEDNEEVREYILKLVHETINR